MRVFFTHIVPNTLPVLCVQLSMSAGTSMLAEAGLTYLGVGVGAGVPSWGHSLSTSVKFISIYPHGRAMARTGRHDGGDRVEPVRRRTARRASTR